MNPSQIQQDFSDRQRRAANTAKYLRILSALYEEHGTTEIVAQVLSEALDGNGNPEIAKLLVDGVRGSMFELLLTIELSWRERKVIGGNNGQA